MKYLSLPRAVPHRRGFTLVEMVVAASMTVAIVVAMSSYFGVIARMSTEKRGSQTLVTGLDSVREQILTDVRKSKDAQVVRYDTIKQMYTSSPYNASPYFFTTVLYTQVPSNGGYSYFAYCVEPTAAATDSSLRGRLVKAAIQPEDYQASITEPIRYVNEKVYPCAKADPGGRPVYGNRVYLSDETTQVGRLQAIEVANSSNAVIGIRFSMYASYDLRVHDPSIPADYAQSPPRLTISGTALTNQLP